MVYVPGAEDGQGAAPASGGKGSSSRETKIRADTPDRTKSGRFIMIGGYSESDTQRNVAPELNDVWELKLNGLRSTKKEKVVCAGCGKYDVGRMLCSGTCGGAVALCSQECLKRVWKEGH